MKRTDSNVRVGRTIAQEWERQESESDRLAARKKAKLKKIVKVLSLLAVLIIIAVIVIMEFSVWLGNREKLEAAKYVPQPTVNIIDEGGTGITNRIKEFVGQLEIDLKDIGLELDRAVIPTGKTREVDVYLKGYDGFYVKLNVDRGTAVSAEDTKRMIQYVTEHGITPQYIDLRVKGKGYYK